MRGILYVRFAEKARPVRTVISSLTGVLGTIRLSQSSKSKSLSDGRREGDALGCPSFWQLYSSSGGLFPAFRTFFPYFLPLLSFLTRGRGRKHKQGKKQNKNEPMRTRFRF